MINKRAVAVTVVLVATAAVAGAPEPTRYDPSWMICESVGEYASCSIIGGGLPEQTGPTRIPRPTQLATNGVPGCVQGASRPVVDTTRPSLSVVFTDPDPALIDVTFEHQFLDGSAEPFMSNMEAYPGQTVVWEEDEAGLQPGKSYRWRVNGTEWFETNEGWSDWCEFTIAAGLLDLTEATDLYAVKELGVDPNRRYPVTLTARQWRLVLESLDDIDSEETREPEFEDGLEEVRERLRGIRSGIREQLAGGRTVTLTGDEWASAAVEVAAIAVSWDMMYEEEPEVGDNGAAYWKVVDRISAELGGPKHPGLGAER